ncbi:MAG: TonB-dependent receptor [Bacteroidia bacterium]|nr:TonB-dependent receptor [Bacteroidia bacterium]
MKKRLLLVIVCMASWSLMSAQGGIIRGNVRDSSSQSILTGANVVIESLKRGSITDVNGNFSLANLPAGEHQLKVSYLTYKDKIVTINVTAKEIQEVLIDMNPIDIKGDIVVISAQALGQTQAINQQLNSDAIANMVSADRIQELPDVNAAEAIARLPGIAINRSGGEGQKVVIRGLEPKFAAITINGVNLPSNSGVDRSVDLSLIAPELLDGIEVFKSPLPDMDAEAVGGTVNLKLRKAPKQFRLLAKVLGGYNQLNNDARDNKSVLQISKRVFQDKLGVVFQGGIERFNRGGDIYRQSWRQGATDSLGVTEIFGNRLTLEDRKEIRRRYNTSLGLDYDLGGNQFAFFGLFSRTTRDRFEMEEIYSPSDQRIEFIGNEIENSLDITFFSLTGNHNLGPFQIDWTLADSRSRGRTPFDLRMGFRDNRDPFDDGLDPDDVPSNYFAAATPNLGETILRNTTLRNSRVDEVTRAATLNLELPYKWGKKISGSLKFGGKYKNILRDRDFDIQSEEFYYLGTEEARRAIAAYETYREENGVGEDLVFLPQNQLLISINSFTQENDINFQDRDGQDIGLNVSLDPEKMRQWYESQRDILNTDRNALVQNYEVDESVAAGYMMFKFKLGDKLTIIPGFRYEYSDNSYSSGLSTVNGRYGVNGFFIDTTTFQRYGEFLPHLHIKVKPNDWLDIRASYAKTLARPDFFYVTPRIQINDSNIDIVSGNPNLRHAVSTNYDLAISAYKGGYGLISLGFFYKQVRDIFYPWETFLVDDSTAQAFGFPNNRGYELSSFTNSPQSTVFGYELDFQTTLSFLPKPLNGLVFNINYSRLYSQTEVFFLTSEQVLIIPVPPIFETIFTNQTREVNMRSQAPHILRTSLGYDYKGFSFRVSAAYQGTKVSNYSVNKDFDTFDNEFWRFDASLKQKFGEHWSLFANLNNISNQRDISFTRNPQYTNTIQTYGWTGTMGLQYKLK